jgi:phosphoribosylanthranilate isomerase
MWVKICGVTTEEDALYAVAMGADALGFNFVPTSPRSIAPARVADIVKRLPPEVVTLGIFRDEHPDRVVQVVADTGLRGAQLHGRETPEVTRSVRSRVQVVLKVFTAGSPDVATARQHHADAYLLDSPSGGSGRVFDWSLATAFPSSLRMVLAGGLHAENVAEAIERVRPWGVDVASGVEAEPGRKDPRRVRAFIAAAKDAGERFGIRDDLDPFDRADRPAGGTGGEPFDWELD